VPNRILELQATPNRYLVYLYNYDGVGNIIQETSLVLRRDDKKNTWGSYVMFDQKTFDEAILEVIKRMDKK